jgi:hypothetical protein
VIRLGILASLAVCAMVHADPPPQAWATDGLKHGVALLPLDAAPSLELYGQPVASELARALVAGGLDVVVVGPKMEVPDRVRVIVDGTIAADGAGVKLVARIRDRQTGKVIDSVPSHADTLGAIDRAASDLSSKLSPAVQNKLVELAKDDADRLAAERAGHAPPPPHVTAPPPVALVALTASTSPLHDALAGALAAWVKQGHHELQLGAADAKAVAAAHADLGITLDVVSYYAEDIQIAGGKAASAYARVRLRISNGTKQVLDRVIATDTVLGDRAHLPELVAREVLWIAEPRLRKVSAWH